MHDSVMNFIRDDLTPAETDLLDALESGDIYTPPTADGNQIPTIRATVIRNILRNAYSDVTPDPKGLRIRGARVEGRIDLDHLISDIPLEIAQSELGGGLTAHNAQLTSLSLIEMTIDRSSRDEAVLHLEDLKIGQLELRDLELKNSNFCALNANSINITGTANFTRLTANGAGPQGAVCIPGAVVGGQLILSGAKLISINGPALVADELTIGLDALLHDGFTAEGSGIPGTVRLSKSTINGTLFLNGAHLTNPDGPALVADGIVVKSDASLADGFTCSGWGELGTVRLLGATINGQFVLRGAHITNLAGPAFNADNLTAGTDVYIDDFTAKGSGNLGTLRIPGAIIKGHLSFQRSRLENPSGPALWAHYSTISADLHLDQGFTAEGDTDLGTIYLLGTTINGQLRAQGAILKNSGGPALFADYLTVGSSARLDGLIAEGSDKDGTVRMRGANLHGELTFSGARLINHTGCALSADDLTVHSNIRLDNGFTATGSGTAGAVRLPAALVKGQLVLNNACLINPHGPLLRAENMVVEFRTVIHLIKVILVHQPPFLFSDSTKKDDLQQTSNALIIFRGASLGELHVSELTLEMAAEGKLWDVTGMTYTALQSTEGMGYKGSAVNIHGKWLSFLRNGTVDFTPQPYQQLSLITHAAGDEQFTRAIRIAQRDDLRARGRLSAWQNRSLWVLKHTVGYGYQSWKAIFWLIGVLVIATFTNLLFAGVIPAPIIIGPLGLAQQGASPSPITDIPCRAIDLMKLSIETIPLIPRSPSNTCGPTDTWAGILYTFLAGILRLAAWALVTLFVAGYTKIVRDPS